ncbi:MAG: GGDEF domain-containing protein [Aquabacterium sp.]|uniref:diguanylate cyclase n=1 Tax=Aquabacterium sp. TaxID=1872578 RepID=UPI0011FBC61B|nr:diguanylate cyclase [Aquabacterium sp.]TAK97832.1 MAG: GGDEF domain-containing protein [Aquabacterium sp.]
MAWTLALWLLCSVALRGAMAAEVTCTRLLLDNAAPVVDLWPCAQIWLDPDHRAGVDALPLQRFRHPDGPYANLGPRSETIWLRVPIRTAQGPDSARRWFTLDFQPLEELTLYVSVAGHIVQQVPMGRFLPFESRQIPTRIQAAELNLPPGQDVDLLLKVRKQADIAVLLPIRLQTPQAVVQGESALQFWQGALFGLGLCLLAYAVVAALALRDGMYVWFGLFVLGATLFSMSYFGLALQHMWPNAPDWNVHATLLAMLVMAIGAMMFNDRALAVHRQAPRRSYLLRILSAMLAVMVILLLLGVVDESQTTIVLTLIEPWPILMLLPLLVHRVWRGERLALWTLVGWFIHAGALFVGMALHRGWAPWSFWIDHAMQVGATLDLIAWTIVLNIRSHELRLAAQAAELERDRLLTASRTDPLTGLFNRRGMVEGLQTLRQREQPGAIAAIFVIDLDGFKPVNDTHGHDVGDKLLVALSERLRGATRNGDLVCRLGGDEFVIATSGLRREDDADRVGDKLLACVAQPFALGEVVCRIGLSMGYALVPAAELDAERFEAALKQADGAMYEAKRAGKGRFCRAREGADRIDA